MYSHKKEIISDEFLNNIAKEINEMYGWQTKVQTEEGIEEEKEN